MLTFHEFIEQVQQNMGGKTVDADRIKQAFDLAVRAHDGQLRKSGEPFVEHPITVTLLLSELGMDSDTLIAGLLHDTVEDTDVTLEDLEKQFGADIALLVDGVTKLGKIKYSSWEEEQAENIRKMLLAMSHDVRVIIIKLCDRMHNMQTIEALPGQKQRDKALETMEVYAPIAHRLGIRQIKEELEDLSLRILDPIAYHEITSMLASQAGEREDFLQRIMERIEERIKPDHPGLILEGRVKSIYGLYRKVYMQGRLMEEIYDIYAVRLIVDTVFECYNCLGIVHDMFTPIPNRFKDYISTPKNNMYQSLHTTLLDRQGVPFEVQIRTKEMHHTAEYGIAAHWKYKVGIQGKDRLDDRLAWVRQLLEAQKDSDDVEDIVRTIKSDIAPEEVFVFTPKGDVKSMPAGSTVIDFAYAIHSAVGNRMVGAKVNGRIVPIDYQVKTGQVVEILTSNTQGQGPKRDWLKIVKTSEARNKIRTWFKKERRDENIAQGKSDVEREFKRNLINLEGDELDQFVATLAKRQHYESVDDYYAAIGYGGVQLSRSISGIRDFYQKQYKITGDIAPVPQKPKKEKRGAGGVTVEGIDNVLVKFARCCNPLPGDDIVGFVTRGYGVSIHKSDCPNVKNIQDAEHEGRFLRAWWDDDVKSSFKTTIELVAFERDGLLTEVSLLLSNMHLNVYELTARKLKDLNTSITLTIEVHSLEHLELIMRSFGRINGIISVERVNK